jgi:adenylate kinase
MRTIVTGTVGLDKYPYLEQVRELAQSKGHDVAVGHVGRRMYAEAPDVAPGRILDLPLSRLHLLRRSVIKDIVALARQHEHLILNTHATFRWRHGVFAAFDFDQFAPLAADMYVCLMDTADALHARLVQDHQIDHSLKDLLVWREEELLGTEMMMRGCALQRAADRPPPRIYAMALGRDNSTARMFYRLMFEPQIRKAYIGFPMTHVADIPELLAEIEEFRQLIKRHFTVFDPADMEEYKLYHDAMIASEQGRKVIETEILGQTLTFEVSEVLQAAGDIHAQIYARDFLLIDQADMIVSYIPELAGGKPAISSGVERELQHAYEATREVFVIWRPQAPPSPFVTETATKVFRTTEEAMQYFDQKGYLAKE